MSSTWTLSLRWTRTAFQDLFNFDLDGLFGGSGDFDLSDMFGGGDSGSIDLSRMLDPDKMNFKLPEMKNLDLDGVLSGVDMTVSTDAIDGMAARLIEGYLDYTSMHPEADYANPGTVFPELSEYGSARKILNDNLLSILAENDTFAVSDEELQQLFKDVLTGYQQYAAEKGYTDPSKFDEYLLEYLRSGRRESDPESVGAVRL